MLICLQCNLQQFNTKLTQTCTRDIQCEDGQRIRDKDEGVSQGFFFLLNKKSVNLFYIDLLGYSFFHTDISNILVKMVQFFIGNNTQMSRKKYIFLFFSFQLYRSKAGSAYAMCCLMSPVCLYVANNKIGFFQQLYFDENSYIASWL